jgi:ABC-type multidrug transport system fused ATPase/permease subunit
MAGLLMAGRIPLDAAAAGVVALQASRQALHSFIQAVNDVYEEALYFTDFSKFCGRAAARIRPSPAGAPTEQFQEITLHEAGLTYPGAAAPALDGVTVTLRRGQTIALVGENGSGKSTTARLLALLYVPTAGDLRWDGTSVNDLSTETLRRQVAFVSQEYWHWPFTARENILIGDPDRQDASDADVVAAAESAGLHATIRQLPRSYDTLLDRTFAEGQELSGGQWQRMAVARALYRDAALLVCDEPSAALDPRAEHELFERLLKRGPGRTTVLISHRLANIRNADQIYVLHGGRVVEQGSHDDLMAASGRYAELFALQADAYRSR